MKIMKKSICACLAGLSLCGVTYAGFTISPELTKEIGANKSKNSARPQPNKTAQPETAADRLVTLEKELAVTKKDVENAQAAVRAALQKLEEINKEIEQYKAVIQTTSTTVEATPQAKSEQALAPLSSEPARSEKTSPPARDMGATTTEVSSATTYTPTLVKATSDSTKAPGAYPLGTTGFRQIPFMLTPGEFSKEEFLDRVLPKGYKYVIAENTFTGKVVVNDQEERTWIQWLDYAAKQTGSVIRVSYRKAMIYLNK